MKHSSFICMGQQLQLNDRNTFEIQKQLIRNGSIIFETVQTKESIQNNQDRLVIAEPKIFQDFYVLLSILFFLIYCIRN